MKIDRNKFIHAALALWLAPIGCTAVKQTGTTTKPGPTTKPGTSPGAKSPTDECVKWDAKNACIEWVAIDQPTDECVEWDPTDECIKWTRMK